MNPFFCFSMACATVTIVSIQLVNELRIWSNSNMVYMVLALGPLFGLIALASKKKG